MDIRYTYNYTDLYWAERFRPLGQRRYELPDHLGNVHTSLSDRKQESKVINDIMTYLPQTASFTDYDPFGFPMPQRNESLQQYRYGFNGQEMDEEVYGEGMTYDFGERIYDSRIGRWFSIDPAQAKYPGLSPYAFVANSPIILKDIGGSDFIITINIINGVRTLTISQNYYVRKNSEYDQLIKAASEINSLTKKVTIDNIEYDLKFEISIIPPNSTPATYHVIQDNEDLTIEMNLAEAFGNDPGGNDFKGVSDKTEKVYNASSGKYSYIGGRAGGNFFYMNKIADDPTNSNPLLVSAMQYTDLVVHEMLHTMGLDDEGGRYYDSKGRMSYNFSKSYKMNNISNKDIENIIRYAIESLNEKKGLPNSSINYGEEIPERFSPNSNIKVNDKNEDSNNESMYKYSNNVTIFNF